MCGVVSLGLDHTAMLGQTLPEIAWQKAGIFKVCSCQHPMKKIFFLHLFFFIIYSTSLICTVAANLPFARPLSRD